MSRFGVDNTMMMVVTFAVMLVSSVGVLILTDHISLTISNSFEDEYNACKLDKKDLQHNLDNIPACECHCEGGYPLIDLILSFAFGLMIMFFVMKYQDDLLSILKKKDKKKVRK